MGSVGRQRQDATFAAGLNIPRPQGRGARRVSRSGEDPGKSNVAKDGTIVATGGDDHEQVPDRLRISEPIPEMEQYADTVKDATCGQQDDRRKRNRREQRAGRGENGPAQEQVENGGKTLERVRVD